MKNLSKKSIALVVLSLALFLPMGCHSPEEEMVYDPQISAGRGDEIIDEPLTKTVVIEVLKPAPEEAAVMAEMEAAPAAAVVANPVPITPLTAPMEFARSVFDDDLKVLPWLANYVGSYGVLPTRIQGDGPFLYAYDVSKNADIFYVDDE